MRENNIGLAWISVSSDRMHMHVYFITTPFSN